MTNDSTDKGVGYGTNTSKPKKRKITLSVDAEIYARAHKLGLNVSAFCEQNLRNGVEALEYAKQNRNNQNNNRTPLLAPDSSGRSGKELGMGIEPTYNSSAGCRLNRSATPAWISIAGIPHKNSEGSVFRCYFNSITML